MNSIENVAELKRLTKTLKNEIKEEDKRISDLQSRNTALSEDKLRLDRKNEQHKNIAFGLKVKRRKYQAVIVKLHKLHKYCKNNNGRIEVPMEHNSESNEPNRKKDHKKRKRSVNMKMLGGTGTKGSVNFSIPQESVGISTFESCPNKLVGRHRHPKGICKE